MSYAQIDPPSQQSNWINTSPGNTWLQIHDPLHQEIHKFSTQTNKEKSQSLLLFEVEDSSFFKMASNTVVPFFQNIRSRDN